MNKVYEIISKKIETELENGRIPWHKPWKGGYKAPKNLITNKEYKGINSMLLGITEYSSSYWATFKQISSKGGKVRKGQKGTMVIFWKLWEKTTPEGEPDKKIPILRYYTVFNTDQCDNLKVPVEEMPKDFSPITEAEAIVNNYKTKPEVKHVEQRAYYSPSLDYVNMPKKGTFDSPEAYYSTLFHELVHSTGHINRLNRPVLTKAVSFGPEDYSREELVAEFGSCFLCGETGIEAPVIDNQARYIANWLRRIKSNRQWLVQASGQAQKAVNYITNKLYKK